MTVAWLLLDNYGFFPLIYVFSNCLVDQIGRGLGQSAHCWNCNLEKKVKLISEEFEQFFWEVLDLVFPTSSSLLANSFLWGTLARLDWESTRARYSAYPSSWASGSSIYLTIFLQIFVEWRKKTHYWVVVVASWPIRRRRCSIRRWRCCIRWRWCPVTRWRGPIRGSCCTIHLCKR